ncbi:MAG: hypothetical protein OXR07_09250, partial [Nitrospira sp.]|nr:hypothetical protein [Nitrospira sp.]
LAKVVGILGARGGVTDLPDTGGMLDDTGNSVWTDLAFLEAFPVFPGRMNVPWLDPATAISIQGRQGKRHTWVSQAKCHAEHSTEETA